jgi:hypothetical protein
MRQIVSYTCGFLTLYVARADRSLPDLHALQKAIEDDLLYDRDEDERSIDFWLNDDQTVLSVTVHERSAKEIEEERVRRLTD